MYRRKSNENEDRETLMLLIIDCDKDTKSGRAMTTLEHIHMIKSEVQVLSFLPLSNQNINNNNIYYLIERTEKIKI